MMNGTLWLSMAFLPYLLILLAAILLACMETLHLYIRTSPAQYIHHRILPALQQRILASMGAHHLSFFDVLLLWLSNLALSGLLLQTTFLYSLQHVVSPFWLFAPAILLSNLATAVLCHWLSQLQPRPMPAEVETQLLGRLATICKGTAKPGSCAQAYVRDQYGQGHEIWVEPEFGEFKEKQQVILFDKRETIYLARLLPIPNHLLES